MQKKNNIDISTQSRSIEWLRFFCASTVVLIHNFGSPIGGEYIVYKNGFFDVVRIFFSQGFCRVSVPIFFLISGYLFFLKLEDWDTNVWINKVKKRVSTLLIPYLLWNFLAMIYLGVVKYAKLYVSGSPLPSLLECFRSLGGFSAFWDDGGGYPIDNPMWFVRNLIIFTAIAPLIYIGIKKLNWIVPVTFFILYISGIWKNIPGFQPVGILFFSIGSVFSIHRISLTDHLLKRWLWITILATLLLMGCVLSYNNSDFPIDYTYFRIPFELVGSASVISIVALLMEKKVLKVRPFLSECSFFVYAAHIPFVLPLVNAAWGLVFACNSQFALTFKYIMTAFLTVVVLMIIYLILKRWFAKPLALLTGGRSNS